MAWALVKQGGEIEELTPGRPLVINHVQYTGDIFDLAERNEAGWSLAALEAKSVYKIVEGDDAPPYFEITDSVLEFENGAVSRVKTFAYVALASHKAALSRAVDIVWAEKTYAGFAYDFGGEIGERTLQTRQEDQSRWLALKDACNDALLAGMGDQTSPIQLRPADNVNISLTFNQIAAALRAMRSQQAGLLAYSWGLKDAITAAPDHETLAAIDITAGWPS
jgi:hypothetical protein